eukprot:m.11033 g.11033  ORF g.11033 m.11033 type:complete len:489 (+) comp5659_c0_seq2:302-1768(+)
MCAEPLPKRNPNHCVAFLQDKGRHCRMMRVRGEEYCADHCRKERIPCPFDPSHTVFPFMLEKHKKKCAKRPKPQPITFSRDCNIGPFAATGEKQSQAEQNAFTSLVQVPAQRLQQVITKLEALSSTHGPVCEEKQGYSQDTLARIKPQHQMGVLSSKHLMQEASILDRMAEHNLFPQQPCAFVEYGAGRANLLHSLRVHVGWHAKHDYVAVERKTGVRNRADRFHRAQPTDNARYQRETIDIQHFDVSKHPFVSGGDRTIVGCSKHLCGVATDLTITSFVKLQLHQPQIAIQGLAVALCCHCVCDWPRYVGQAFFQNHGLDHVDFSILKLISTWGTLDPKEDIAATQAKRRSKEERRFKARSTKIATSVCASLGAPASTDDGDFCEDDRGAQEPLDIEAASNDCGDDDDEVPAVTQSAPHALGLSREHMVRLGQMAKRLIDQGRVLYLQQHGWNTHLIRYVERDVTPENLLLIATPPTQDKRHATSGM